METAHNPDRYMADLRQALSQGRKRIGLLVGAGAPQAIRVNRDGCLDPNGSALIGGVDEITQSVLASLQDEKKVAADSIYSDLHPTPNIEGLLSRIRLLEQAIGSTKVNGLDSLGYKQLGQSICAEIGKLVGPKLPKQRNSYNELVGWISGTLRSHSVEIFTTNYDLLFEEAFEQARVPYFDGFSGGASPFFDPVSVASDELPPRWSRLWKLHGSLGWSVEDGMVVRRGNREANELVYPDYLKYDLTQKQPYSALFERLKSFLQSPDTLLMTVGFSFRDAHISAVIDEALAVNSNSAVLAFQYGPLANEECACRLGHDRPNVSVYAADGAVINGVKGEWRPGELAKNWADIRKMFWDRRNGREKPEFLLGDFQDFARFCALTQSTGLASTTRTATQISHAEPASSEVDMPTGSAN